jgi:hypothetical protein
MMRNRAESIEQIFAGMAERGELNKILKIRLSREMGAMENAGQILALTQAFLMKGIQIMDSATAGVVWRAKYSEVTEKTLKQRTAITESKDKTDEEKEAILQKMEDAAIRAADALVRKTQSMGGNLNTPGSFRPKSAIAKTFSMFMNDANQNYNLLFETIAGWKNRSGAEAAALLFVHGILPGVIMGLVSMGPAPLPDDPGDPEEWWERAKDTLRRWKYPEDYIEWLFNSWFGGIPLFGEGMTLVGAGIGAYARNKRGRGWHWTPGDFGTSAVQGLGGDVEGVIRDLAREKQPIEEIVRLSLKLAGIPGAVPVSRIAGTKESGDWRRLMWSEYALTDRSVEAAMVKRADKSGMEQRTDKWGLKGKQEFERFNKWYGDLDQKHKEAFDRYYERAVGMDGMVKRADDAMSNPEGFRRFDIWYDRLSEEKKDEFEAYYNKTLDDAADESIEAEYKLMDESLGSRNKRRRDWANKRKIIMGAPPDDEEDWETWVNGERWEGYTKWNAERKRASGMASHEKGQAEQGHYRKLEAAGRR